MNTHAQEEHNWLRIFNGMTSLIGALIIILPIVAIINSVESTIKNSFSGNTIGVGLPECLFFFGVLVIGPLLLYMSNHTSKVSNKFSHWDCGCLSSKDKSIGWFSILIGLLCSGGVIILLAAVLSALKERDE